MKSVAAYQQHVTSCLRAANHISHLQKEIGGTDGSSGGSRGPIKGLGGDVYRVECLLAQRMREGKRQFLVPVAPRGARLATPFPQSVPVRAVLW